MPDAFAFEELHAVAAAEPRDLVRQARSIIDAATAEADRIRDAAREAGYADGLVAGRDEAVAALQPGAQALAAALAAARECETEMADRIEGEACRLALAAAERIVAGSLQAEPQRVLDVVRGALRAAVERERVTIQLNPADLELVRDALAELASIGGIEHLDVQEERRVTRGGAIVRTAVGEIDAQIETKLERLRTAFASEALE